MNCISERDIFSLWRTKRTPNLINLLVYYEVPLLLYLIYTESPLLKLFGDRVDVYFEIVNMCLENQMDKVLRFLL